MHACTYIDQERHKNKYHIHTIYALHTYMLRLYALHICMNMHMYKEEAIHKNKQSMYLYIHVHHGAQCTGGLSIKLVNIAKYCK